MNPSQLRKKILAEHVIIRGKVKEAEALAGRVLGGDATAELPMRAHATDLVELFREHLEMEDALLVPTLRNIDAWGQIRAERVAREHEWQRAALERLEQAAKREATADVARAVESLGKELLADMKDEDETILSPNLLKDDPITVDQADG